MKTKAIITNPITKVREINEYETREITEMYARACDGKVL